MVLETEKLRHKEAVSLGARGWQLLTAGGRGGDMRGSAGVTDPPPGGPGDGCQCRREPQCPQDQQPTPPLFRGSEE